MTDRPAYLTNHVEEKDVTVDWFFGDRRFTKKIGQLLLLLLGWFAAALPVVITASALRHRDDPGGVWNYHEGFVMWDVTIRTLTFLFVFFIVAFGVMYLLNRRIARRDLHRRTYDEERLAQRCELAGELYVGKYGPEELRLAQSTVRIEPYLDFETYELRDHYRSHGVD